jgi:TonB family protein
MRLRGKSRRTPIPVAPLDARMSAIAAAARCGVFTRDVRRSIVASANASGGNVVRVIAFLLLMTAVAAAQPVPPPPPAPPPPPPMPFAVGAHAAVTPEALGQEMFRVAACSATAGAPPFDPPPMAMIVHVYIEKGAATHVNVMISSGNAAFDQKAVQCLQGLPADFMSKVGNMAMFIPISASNGSVAPLTDPSAVTMPVAIASSSGGCSAYYPPIAMRLGEEGDTELQFTVAANGTVKDVSVANSSGHDMLDQAAVQCAAQWRYKPATRNGVPFDVSRHTVVRFRFASGTAPSPEIIALQAAYRKVRLAGFRCIGSSLPSDDDLKLAAGKTTLTITLKEGVISDVKTYQTSGNDKLDKRAVECFRSVQTSDNDTKALALARELPIFVDWSPAGVKSLSNIAAH